LDMRCRCASMPQRRRLSRSPHPLSGGASFTRERKKRDGGESERGRAESEAGEREGRERSRGEGGQRAKQGRWRAESEAGEREGVPLLGTLRQVVSRRAWLLRVGVSTLRVGVTSGCRHWCIKAPLCSVVGAGTGLSRCARALRRVCVSVFLWSVFNIRRRALWTLRACLCVDTHGHACPQEGTAGRCAECVGVPVCPQKGTRSTRVGVPVSRAGS
jgi:hypothetical protein